MSKKSTSLVMPATKESS